MARASEGTAPLMALATIICPAPVQNASGSSPVNLAWWFVVVRWTRPRWSEGWAGRCRPVEARGLWWEAVHSEPAGDADPSVRTDDLRVAFNSLFWPHVLASTSVGQEGLDFHTWCAAVAHWDLPGSPVDLEQREGRVDRYAGLSTRRVLASRFAPRRSAVEPGSSPWAELAQRADRAYRSDPAGLTPWWIIEGARVQRLVFDVPLSEANARFEHLRQQRLVYRLTLGQPDQADLVRPLHGRLTSEEAVAATIDLSPWSSP